MLRVPCHFVCDCRWEGASARVRVYVRIPSRSHIHHFLCIMVEVCGYVAARHKS